MITLSANKNYTDINDLGIFHRFYRDYVKIPIIKIYKNLNRKKKHYSEINVLNGDVTNTQSKNLNDLRVKYYSNQKNDKIIKLSNNFDFSNKEEKREILRNQIMNDWLS